MGGCFSQSDSVVVLIDNTRNWEKAHMTPILLNIIRKRVRCELLSDKRDIELFIRNENIKNLKGIVLSGGPLCLSDPVGIHMYNSNILMMLLFPKVPVLGVCFGFQVMAECYGGRIVPLKTFNSLKEHGGIFKGSVINGGYKRYVDRRGCLSVKNLENGKFAKGFSKSFLCYHWHRDVCVKAPMYFKVTLVDEYKKVGTIIEGFESAFPPNLGIGVRIGCQFHPEGNSHTHNLINNFLDVCLYP